MIKEGVQSRGLLASMHRGVRAWEDCLEGGRKVSPLLVGRMRDLFSVFTKGEAAKPPSNMHKKLVSSCACLLHDLGRLMNADRGIVVLELSRPPRIDGQLLLETQSFNWFRRQRFRQWPAPCQLLCQRRFFIRERERERDHYLPASNHRERLALTPFC